MAKLECPLQVWKWVGVSEWFGCKPVYCYVEARLLPMKQTVVGQHLRGREESERDTQTDSETDREADRERNLHAKYHWYRRSLS